MFEFTSYFVPASPRARMLRIGARITVYWSYETIVALRIGPDLILSPNEWGRTTARHLRVIAQTNSDATVQQCKTRAEFEEAIRAVTEMIDAAVTP